MGTVGLEEWFDRFARATAAARVRQRWERQIKFAATRFLSGT
jgi:hypothetical protein